VNAPSHLRSRPWMMFIVLIGLVAGHGILLYLLRERGISHAGISGVVASGVILLAVAKHLGLFAFLHRPLHGLCRRRFLNGEPEEKRK
jgi:hypothetical protein